LASMSGAPTFIPRRQPNKPWHSLVR